MTEYVYDLINENLSHLGGRMGTEYTTDESMGLFYKKEDAKLAAEKHYGKKIKWKRSEDGISSGDLLYVEYHIIKKEIK